MTFVSRFESVRFSAFSIVLSVSTIFGVSTAFGETDPFNCGGKNECLKSALSSEARSGKRSLSYDKARDVLFQKIDAVVVGSSKQVDSVYTNDTITLFSSSRPHSSQGFNTEHTWPQSKLKAFPNSGESITDLHHLFPCEIKMNAIRGHMPFTDIPGEPGGTGRISEVAKNKGFEPPEDHKGVVARAMFYMSVTYKMPIDSNQEALFRQWNKAFPVTAEELGRVDRVEENQGNRNPFVDNPQYVELVTDF